MIRLAPLLLLATLPACDRFASPGEQAVAAGPWRAVATASRVARRCGVRDTRVQPLGKRQAAVFMGYAHPPEAEQCLRAWIDAHPEVFDRALLARVRAG
jgi:hypothetical protein